VKRSCRECGEKLNGRSDKIYCSDHCRTTYYNRVNGDSSKLIRDVNRILRKNRRILSALNPDGKTKVHKKELEMQGFNFNYFTSTYSTQKGNEYHFCYEQGYLELTNGYYALVIRQRYAV